MGWPEHEAAVEKRNGPSCQSQTRTSTIRPEVVLPSTVTVAVCETFLAFLQRSRYDICLSFPSHARCAFRSRSEAVRDMCCNLITCKFVSSFRNFPIVRSQIPAMRDAISRSGILSFVGKMCRLGIGVPHFELCDHGGTSGRLVPCTASYSSFSAPFSKY
jgi:hypothetical protein